MFLWSIVLCVAPVGVLVGAVLLDQGVGDLVGVALIVAGVALTILALVRVIRLNRAYQDHHLAEVLRNPAEIIARWQTPEHEVILAERGLFLGRAFLPFRAGYQRLRGASLSDDDARVTLVFDAIGKVPPPPRTLTVPPEQRAAVRAFIDRITRG